MPHTSFYLPAIHEMVDLTEDFITWRRNVRDCGCVVVGVLLF